MLKPAVVVLLLCALAAALPNPQPKKPLKVPSVEQVKNDEDWQPPNVYTTMKIGTPGISFTLQMDQYFPDAMLRGPDCTSLSCKGVNNNRTIYDPKKSSTAKDMGDPAKLHYGTTVTGEYYTDSVQVDGITDTDVGFAVLKTASSQFYKIGVDGVFGLSFLGNPRGKKLLPSPVDSILKGATNKLVNLWFNQAKSNADRYGQITFGKVNTDKCDSTVQYSLVSDDDFTFKLEKIRYANFVAHRELTAKIDPQSRYIGLPTTIYMDLLRVATGSTTTDYVDCDDIKGMTLDIKIGGVYYSLNVEDFTYQEETSWQTKNCHFLVQDNQDEFDTGYILGEPFFRRYCITYDVENRQIGFSSAK